MPDDCDIAEGTSFDCNVDGVPDECPGCAADCVCDDGDLCSGIETCVDGACVLGTPCDDQDPCNGKEICDPATGVCLAGVITDCNKNAIDDSCDAGG